MMRAWKKRTLSMVLAGFILMTLVVTGYADEAAADPEKDLTIGSEYGGGESPGGGIGNDFSVEKEGDPYELSPKDMTEENLREIDAIIAAEFSEDGSKMNSEVSGNCTFYYGFDEQHYDDGSFGSVFSVMNISGEDLTIDMTAVAENSYGAMLDLDAGSANGQFTVKTDHTRSFYMITPEKYSKINCKVSFTTLAGETIKKDFTIKAGQSNTKTVNVQVLYPPDDPIWDTIPSEVGSVQPCTNCGADPIQSEDDQGISVWLYVLIALAVLLAFVLAYFICRHFVGKRKQSKV